MVTYFTRTNTNGNMSFMPDCHKRERLGVTRSNLVTVIANCNTVQNTMRINDSIFEVASRIPKRCKII